MDPPVAALPSPADARTAEDETAAPCAPEAAALLSVAFRLPTTPPTTPAMIAAARTSPTPIQIHFFLLEGDFYPRNGVPKRHISYPFSDLELRGTYKCRHLTLILRGIVVTVASELRLLLIIFWCRTNCKTIEKCQFVQRSESNARKERASLVALIERSSG